MPNFGKFSVPNTKISQNPGSLTFYMDQKSLMKAAFCQKKKKKKPVQQAPKFGADLF